MKWGPDPVWSRIRRGGALGVRSWARPRIGVGATRGPVDAGTSAELALLVKRHSAPDTRAGGASVCEEHAPCCGGIERGQRMRQVGWDLSLQGLRDRVASLGSLTVGGVKGTCMSRRT